MTAYDGQSITYDGIGNPLTYGNTTYTWEHGRELSSLSNGTDTWIYTYDANGMRTMRTNGTTTYTYVYNGSQLTQMTVGANVLHFVYGAKGEPIAVKLGTVPYCYMTNLQGDVVAITNPSGVIVVMYQYDAWGNIVSVTGSMASTLGVLNPLTYRGYVYDHETGLYYLQSRYYNPEWGRFLNADGYISTGGLLGNNPFLYCLNNPVNYHDPSGNFGLVCCHGQIDLFMGGVSDFCGGGGGMSCWVALAPHYAGETKGEGALKKTTQDIPGGHAYGIIGLYEYGFFSLSDSGITFAEASWAMIDATYKWDQLTATLFRAFSVDVFAGANIKEGLAVQAMASMISASAEYKLGPLSIEATGFVGAIGFSAGILVDGFTIGYANGVGGELTIRWTLD